ncbi:zinc ABC transporter substrate-binding protein [Rhodobacteraceae bacterium]|nr:zinc ABC transporter substrate-binding protein [Paracoccaceae bacterium]
MFRSILIASVVFAAPLRAEVPSVLTDIAPVHSLVSMVMEGVGTPQLLLRPGTSPHSYAMRPSEAAALQSADVVVWVGDGLTPWLEGPIERLAGDAEILGLLEIAPVQRENAEDHHDGHDDEHDDEQDDHTAEHEDDHHDDHGDIDPHAWLDPENAIHWVRVIADTLATRDAENGDTYRKNASAAAAKIADMQSKIAATFAEGDAPSYAVQHDGYGYFEARFGLAHAFAITTTHAVSPGPARIAELRESVLKSPIDCVLTDGFEAIGLLNTVLEGHQTRVVNADPTGAEFTPGPLLYIDLTRNLADTIAAC